MIDHRKQLEHAVRGRATPQRGAPAPQDDHQHQHHRQHDQRQQHQQQLQRHQQCHERPQQFQNKHKQIDPVTSPRIVSDSHTRQHRLTPPSPEHGVSHIPARNLKITKTSLSSKILALVVLFGLHKLAQELSNQLLYTSSLQSSVLSSSPHSARFIQFVDALECTSDSDCGSRDKICHENNCICAKDRPVEDQDRCLSLSLINEPCSLGEQCLGNSQCLDGICSCGNDAISLYNPSAKLYYCHPKRRLHEECNYDSQCPSNSYCSTNKFGCLCSNGYAEATVSSDGTESLECLPKFCSNSGSCESEYHHCVNNRCECLALHFDPTSGRCYEYGSIGGKPADLLQDPKNANGTNVDPTRQSDDIYSIFRDLTENSDKLWLVLIILILMSVMIIVLILIFVRKQCLGYCWTAHKKEYEPNNKNPPKSGYFNKTSINNKSFRRKNGEAEAADEDELPDADRETLVAPIDPRKNGSFVNRNAFMTSKDQNYVRVDLADEQRGHSSGQTTVPLPSSTSTPV